MIRLLSLLVLAGLWYVATPQADAQPRGAPPNLSEEAEITLVTILPGDDIPSMYGHTAFRVVDAMYGIDWSYNYGTYDFADPLFIPKFMYGDLEYYLGVSSFPVAAEFYEQQRRPIIEQRLNLNAEERDLLFRALQIEAQPENRYYQYDFFFDNCSTRPRDVLTSTFQANVDFHPPNGSYTFRELIAPYAADRPFLDLGMNTLLGPRTDRTASGWEQLFLPDHLMAAAEEATIERDNAEPLVAQTDTLFWPEGYERQEAAINWPLLLGWIIFGGGLGVSLWQVASNRRISPLPDALLLFAVGLIGLLVFFLAAISLHDVARFNMHLLWAWPTHLWAAAAVIRGYDNTFFRGYMVAAATAALLTAAAWFVLPQVMPPALLPIALLLAARCAWIARVRSKKAPAEPVGEPQPATEA